MTTIVLNLTQFDTVNGSYTVRSRATSADRCPFLCQTRLSFVRNPDLEFSVFIRTRSFDSKLWKTGPRWKVFSLPRFSLIIFFLLKNIRIFVRRFVKYESIWRLEYLLLSWMSSFLARFCSYIHYLLCITYIIYS